MVGVCDSMPVAPRVVWNASVNSDPYPFLFYSHPAIRVAFKASRNVFPPMGLL